VFDDDLMLVRVVNFLFDSSLELTLDSSPPLTHSPKWQMIHVWASSPFF